jgi:hypothetical protein
MYKTLVWVDEVLEKGTKAELREAVRVLKKEREEYIDRIIAMKHKIRQADSM